MMLAASFVTHEVITQWVCCVQRYDLQFSTLLRTVGRQAKGREKVLRDAIRMSEFCSVCTVRPRTLCLLCDAFIPGKSELALFGPNHLEIATAQTENNPVSV